MAPARSSMVDPCEALRPLFVSMRVLGFFFSQRPSQVTHVRAPQGQDVAGNNEQSWARTDRRRSLANRTYCLSVCCLLWCRALSFVPSFWVWVDLTPGVSMKACFVIWLLQCSLNASVSLYESVKGNAFSSFYQVWKTLQMKEACERSTEEEEEEEDSVSEETMSCAHIALSYRDAGPSGNPAAVADKTEYSHSHSHCRDRSCGKTASRRNNVNDTYPGNRDGNTAPSSKTHQTTDERSRKHHEDANNDDDEGHKTDKDGDKDHKNGDRDPRGESSPEDDQKDADSHSKNQLTSGGKSTFQTERDPKRSLNKYERIGILYTVIAWVAVVFSDVVPALFVFNAIPEVEDMTRAITTPFGTALPVKIAMVGVHFVATSAWIFPPVVCYSLCVLLWTRFSFLTASITTTLSQTEDRFPSMLERWRQEHLRLSQCVVTLNGYVGKMLMVSYATNLPLAVLLLYQMTVGKVEGGLGSTLINVYWFLMALLNITLVSVFAAFVHDAAHSPLERLFFVRADQASPIQLAQLQLFLSKLSATSIGFDVLGITITKEIILTLYGLLFTYFVVLIPYQL